MVETSELLKKNRKLIEIAGYEVDEEPEQVQSDELERGNRALVLYERKKRDEELDRLEKQALRLLIERLERMG